MRSYLSGIIQKFSIDDVCSSTQSDEMGVPQGSVSGALRWSCYLLPSELNVNFHIYADDSVVFCLQQQFDSSF